MSESRHSDNQTIRQYKNEQYKKRNKKKSIGA